MGPGVRSESPDGSMTQDSGVGGWGMLAHPGAPPSCPTPSPAPALCPGRGGMGALCVLSICLLVTRRLWTWNDLSHRAPPCRGSGEGGQESQACSLLGPMGWCLVAGTLGCAPRGVGQDGVRPQVAPLCCRPQPRSQPRRISAGPPSHQSLSIWPARQEERGQQGADPVSLIIQRVPVAGVSACVSVRVCEEFLA